MKLALRVCVFLLMARASVCADITVRAAEGGEAVINCPYYGGYETSYKYFYKGPYKESTLWLKSDGGESPVFNGRFSLKDDHKAGLFTVTIRDLQMNDAGPYTCAAGWGDSKLIQLNVIRAPKKHKPVQISTSTTHSDKTSDQALRSSSHTGPDLSSSAVNPQSTVSTFTDHHVSSDSFMIIITAEASVLLLIALPLLILVVRQRKKPDGLCSTEFTTGIYQQIKDNPADRDTHTTVCYSCV
ncbi:CMRF35-like molecule 5 [Danio aesculapii]|uniref:CMRF35-like molecule 5 n=1 Tax=Danio aesculapii TaxID=1142201 RepID=UPI0024C005A5|nr:CMRF35-like molecule 5 [Danio aesculapii]